jgi:hypothetical protein
LRPPVGTVETAFRAHGLALHRVNEFRLDIRGGTVLGLDVWGAGAKTRVLALPRPERDLEVLVFTARSDVVRVAALLRGNRSAAVLVRGRVLVVYDRAIQNDAAHARASSAARAAAVNLRYADAAPILQRSCT